MKVSAKKISMAKKLILVLAVLALVASAGTVTKLSVYHVTFVKAATVNHTELKAGDYKIAVGDANATITPAAGGTPVVVPVKIETGAVKYDGTAVTYESRDSKNMVSEIDLGGSKTKLVFAQ